MDARHPYEQISLFSVGIIVAIWLISFHSFMLVKPQLAQSFLKKLPRNQQLGQVILGFGLAWFWLLIAPEGMGKISSLRMDLGEFNNFKPILRLLVPAALVLVSISVRDFLAVRALGLVGLMAAAPLLEAAFLKDPSSRLLIPIFAYLLLTVSLFNVGMPFLFRDAVGWITANSKRWQAACIGGLLYGIATAVCAVAFWRGY